jgi:thioesterase domain-containing protein
VSALFKAPSLGEFAAYLARFEDEAKDSWRTVRIQPKGDKTPIIAINDAMLYGNLAHRIGTDRPFYGVALFDPADPHPVTPESLNEIAAKYVGLIREMQPHGPYILFGYCVAGIIAYEAARQLRDQGEAVPLVIVADSWAPGYVRSMPFIKRLTAEAAFRIHVLRHQFGEIRRGQMSFGELLASYRLVRKSRILDLAVGLHLLKQKPHGREDGQDQWFLGHLSAARESYCIGETSGDVMVLQSDIIVTRFAEASMGWRRLVKGRLMLQRVPGWHGEMFKNEGPGVIAEALQPSLDAIDAATRKAN